MWHLTPQFYLQPIFHSSIIDWHFIHRQGHLNFKDQNGLQVVQVRQGRKISRIVKKSGP